MDIVKKVKDSKSFSDLKKIFKGMQSSNWSKLNVLIVNLPCNGFGDIIFAMKFANILKQWYDCKITILTPHKKAFISLGEKSEHIYELKGKSKENNCRRLSNLDIIQTEGEVNINADLIFVAPLQADFNPDLNDIKRIFHYANKYNTFFLSEYNDSIRKKIDFHTGVGGSRYGLLFTDTEIGNPLEKIKNPYAVIYIQPSFGQYKYCLFNFVEMVSKKHKKKDFELIIPNWVMENPNLLKDLISLLLKYFGTVIVKGKENTDKIEQNRDRKTVYIRFDIFPVENKVMIDLMAHSVKDILVTGDQSITDVLSCCVDKNIFYQIAPWKENFAKNLAKEMPNKWLQKKRRSCGGLKAINYKSNYVKFKKTWDFRNRAKPEMDGIFYFAAEKKYGKDKEDLTRLEKIGLKSRTVKSFLKSYDSLKNDF